MANKRSIPPTRRNQPKWLATIGVGVCLLLVFPLLFAASPAWWSSALNTNPSDDYAAANIGQLKYFASKACEELDAHLPGQAGNVVNNLVNSWSAAPLPGNIRDDFAAVTLGQLKAVAAPFYDRLIAVGYATDYPWTLDTTDDDDYAIANLGQIKQVFSFDPVSVDLQHDSNQDGLPDWWEIYYFSTININPAESAGRGDGLTILQAFQQGLAPDFYQGQPPVLTMVSGNNQTGGLGGALAEPLLICVTDQGGNPIANAPLTFYISAGLALEHR